MIFLSKAKILAILPYQGLKNRLLETAKKHDDVEVHAFVGDMIEGVEVVKSISQENYSVILSRAGTASLIEQVVNIPVIDIGISIYDMLRAIRLSQSYEGKFAIVGFPMITKYAVLINDLLEYQLNIFTVNDTSEILECLNKLKDIGFELIVGDMITVNNARRVGLNTILVTSGEESIDAALTQCIKWHIHNEKLNEHNKLLRSILHKLNQGICVFSLQKELLYSMEPAAISDHLRIQSELHKYVDTVITNNDLKLIKKIGDNSFFINASILNYNDIKSVAFFYEIVPDIFKPKNRLVTYRNLDDAPSVNLETFPYTSIALKKAMEYVTRFSTTSLPIVIYGPRGCGKDSFAYAIYRKSIFQFNPLITVDCKFASGKLWASLLESEKSPLNRAHFTVYFKNLHLLTDAQQAELESYLENTYIQKRNRLIFSFVYDSSTTFVKGSLMYYICNVLGSLSLLVPTLNERTDDIPNLATLYLNELNSKMGKQVIGLQINALKALKEHHWENNLDQFKKVIQKLFVMTDSPYISEQLTCEVLEKDSPLVGTSQNNIPIDLSGTLDEITKNIIKLILEQENMNQSKAAKRLNISRSTLWKKLQ